jgi:hypothetical protein
MNFSELDIITLYKLRKNIHNEEELLDDLKKIEEAILIKENLLIDNFNEEFTSSPGGLSYTGSVPSSGGSAYVTQGNINGIGGVTNRQPGITPAINMNIADDDVSVPYLALVPPDKRPEDGVGMSGKKIYQKIQSMGYYHGSRTGKKSRLGKGVLQNLRKMRDMRAQQNQKPKDDNQPSTKSKVFNFDDFAKADINKIKK